jgi:hypothetical protein
MEAIAPARAQLVPDEDLVEVDVAVDEGRQDQLLPAVHDIASVAGGPRGNCDDPFALDGDVHHRAVRETGILQSPHGGLTLASGPVHFSFRGRALVQGRAPTWRWQLGSASATSSIPRIDFRGRRRS